MKLVPLVPLQNYNMKAVNKFNQLVLNKYNLYNGLFMSLPYEKIENIGMLIPILESLSKKGYQEGKTPTEIINEFFTRFTEMKTDEEKNNFLFRIIQYVERQVVLFDSVEDASFNNLKSESAKEGLFGIMRISKSRGKEDLMREILNKFAVRIVFTAHPTQFYPPSVQTILHDLKNAIEIDNLTEIDLLLQQLGQTPFINKDKPTPLEEAKSIIYYLRNVYYQAMGEMVSDIQEKYFDGKDFNNFDILQLGFWPGGDRDGNPFVTYDITKNVAIELRTTLMKCYYNELKTLRRKLTFRDVEPILQELSDSLYSIMFTGKRYLKYEEILQPLLDARKIVEDKYHGLFIESIDALITRVKIFKTHFATIDVRQDGPKHQEIIEDIFNQYGLLSKYNTASKAEKIELLTNPGVVVDADKFEDLTKETILNVTQIREIQESNGEQGLNRYIISNAEDIYDVLNVYCLFRLCGYDHDAIIVDIVPLFETMKGMNGSEATMSDLYTMPVYQKHLARRGRKQSIMLGFSDGTKDGGYLKANWEIFRTKETLSKVSDANDIEVVFFDGRGGPPARGGGKSHRFYASQGKNIANHEIQLTIQGQTITSMYGNVDQFKYNCEQLLKAGVINHIFDLENTHFSSDQRSLMDELAKISYSQYGDLKSHPQFMSYLEEISTLKYYGKANIGSRPGKRGNKAKLEFSDLRAISFVGSWSQLKQNVPGYYGIGTAINTLKSQGRMQEVIELFNKSAFFKTLMLNSMMSIEKSYFPLTKYIKENPVYKDFWDILHNEYELSKAMLLELSGYKELMEEELQSKASIAIREKIVMPLLTIQQYALQQIAKGAENKESYEMMVTRSLFGNINASRNSA